MFFSHIIFRALIITFALREKWIEGFYFESGYLGRGCYALNIEICDSISDFLSLQMYQNYPKANISMIAILWGENIHKQALDLSKVYLIL
jgi:hypothetical protein